MPIAVASRPTPTVLASDKKAGFKNPLDVTVDEKGRTAWVVLPLAKKTAVVDLVRGRVTKELPLEGWEPSEITLRSRGIKEEDGWGRPLRSQLPSEGVSLRTASLLPKLNEFIQKQAVSDYLGTTGDRFGLIVYRYAKTNLSTTQVSQGWIFTTGITFHKPAFKYKKPENITIAAVDEPQQAFADASDMVITPDEKHAFLAFAGSDKVLAINVGKLLSPLTKKKTQKGQANRAFPVFDLTASRRFVVAKLPTQANSRRLALSGDGKTLVVSNYLADSLTVIDAVNLKVLRHISLGGPKPDAARRGEILFNSAKMTFHGQFTCASCHPDGGSDGLTWDLTRDGIGNFKKTKSLLGVKDTAPYGWHGSSPTLADRVEGTLRMLHQHEPKGTEVADLVAYLKTLPPPKPPTPNEADKPAIARGKKIFQGKGQCTNCHRRAALDDGKTHDIGTRGPGDTQGHFDTPALLGVSRTAPYLHDGRAKSLRAIFRDHNPKNRHGAAHKLTGKELDDLINYLESL
jgi:YVTN family beta-propeller protein